MERLWVDFNNMSEEGVRLNCKGTLDEIERKLIKLVNGLEIIVWDDDINDAGIVDNLSVKAIVKYSEIEKIWVAAFDSKDLMHDSERI